MPVKVFIGNLRENCSRESIEDLLAPYGKILEVSMLSKFAFVHFDKKEDADKAVKDLHKTKMFGQTINVEISRNQGKPPNARVSTEKRQQERPPMRRGGDMRGQIGPPNPGILGLGPNAMAPPNPLAPLNLLTQVNQLAALGNQVRGNELLADRNTVNQNSNKEAPLVRENLNNSRSSSYEGQQRNAREAPEEKPDPDVRVRREVVHTRDIPERHRSGLGDGYVIYERYYVDPSHSLLRGVRLSDLPRIGDSYLARDAPRADREYNTPSSHRDSDRHDTPYRDADRRVPPQYRDTNGRPAPQFRESEGRPTAAYQEDDARDRSPLSMREMREREYIPRGRVDPYSRR